MTTVPPAFPLKEIYRQKLSVSPLSPFCKDGEGDTVKKKSLKKN